MPTTPTMGSDTTVLFEAVRILAGTAVQERRQPLLIELGAGLISFGLSLSAGAPIAVATKAAAPRVQQRKARRTPTQMAALSPGVAVPKTRARRRTRAEMEAVRGYQGNGSVQIEEVQPAAE
jgi:hypothetical protein